jgi:hypothetical protein
MFHLIEVHKYRQQAQPRAGQGIDPGARGLVNHKSNQDLFDCRSFDT